MGDYYTSNAKVERNCNDCRQKIYKMEIVDLDKKVNGELLLRLLFEYHFEEVLHPVEIINLAFRCDELKNKYPKNKKITYIERLININEYISKETKETIKSIIQDNENEKETIIKEWKELNACVFENNREDIIKVLNKCEYILGDCYLNVSPKFMKLLTKKYSEISDSINSYKFFQTLSNRAENENFEDELFDVSSNKINS